MRRFDLDGDAKLSFQEFAEALTPIQPDVIQNPKRHNPMGRSGKRSGSTSGLSVVPDNVQGEDDRSLNEKDMKNSVSEPYIAPSRIHADEARINN